MANMTDADDSAAQVEAIRSFYGNAPQNVRVVRGHAGRDQPVLRCHG